MEAIWYMSAEEREVYARLVAEASLVLPSGIRPLLAAFEGYDPLDVAAAVAALQLMPENADRQARLEVVAGLVASVKPVRGQRLIDRAQMERLFREPPFGDDRFVGWRIL